MIYTDTASISFSTSVLFNYPFPCFARLPVSLTLSLSVFSSKVRRSSSVCNSLLTHTSQIVLTPPRPTSHIPALTFALAPSFTLDLRISSLLGSRAKLADVPKLHDMIESQIKKTLASHGSWTVVLPGVTRPKVGADVHCKDDGIDVKLVNESLGRPPDLLTLNI